MHKDKIKIFGRNYDPFEGHPELFEKADEYLQMYASDEDSWALRVLLGDDGQYVEEEIERRVFELRTKLCNRVVGILTDAHKSLVEEYKLKSLNDYIQIANKAITKHKLESFAKECRENNPNGGDDYYHNTAHMWGVAGIAYSLIPKDFHYRAGAISGMLLACLFHDYDHTLGEEPDEVNIQRAIDGFRKVFDKIEDKSAVDWKVRIMENIRITQYPYTQRPNTIWQECIRDADVLYSMISPEIAIKLYKELGLPMNNLVEERRTFLEGLEIFTAKGKYIFNNTKEQHLRDLQNYIDLTM